MGQIVNNLIKNAYENGKLVLFLGAGASRSSRSRDGNELLDGWGLAKCLAEEAGWPYADEPLSTVYGAVRKVLGKQVDEVFSRLYQHCSPSGEYLRLAEYPWARVYTTNIDDALEVAFRNKSPQKVHVRNRNDGIADQDNSFERLDLVKLNGSSDRPDLGYIFSPQEYGKSAASIPQWYRELGSDFFQYVFVFIGTKLNESIFYHQVEHYRSIVKSGVPKSYVITPSASLIEVANLSEMNLEHLEAGLEDFVDWLKKEIPSPPKSLDLAFARNPSLKEMFDKHSRAEKEKYVDLFSGVTLVSRTVFSGTNIVEPGGTIRDFYRGFKPTWQDIVDGVPAELETTNAFQNTIIKNETAGKIIVLYGPAGSGKSTILKQIAIKLSDDSGGNVYFLEEASENFKDLIEELEKTNSKAYYVVIDRLDAIRNELSEVLASERMKKGVIIGCERQNIWHSRLSSIIGDYCAATHVVKDINENDAHLILQRIEQFGPWTRLSNLSAKQRIRELLDKSKRQLLIGLLETTSGVGFERLIEKDYASLSETSKLFMIVVSLCTVHRQGANESLVSRSLTDLGITEAPQTISRHLSGIVEKKGKSFIARHPVYARRVLESIVDMEVLAKCIKSLIFSFSVFPHPVVRHLDKPQAIVFKSIINHNFLKDVLRNNQTRILEVYEIFEKVFENDGLYWLQYGLAMRDFDMQPEAYDRLLTAYNAYPHDHTSHALAQQELIMAQQECVSTAKANDYLSSAKERLESLDRTLSSDDTYPIVTLAEGHTKIAIRMEGASHARIVAREYCKKLENRIRENAEQRLTEAYTRLLKFSTTGTWTEEQ